MAILIVTIVTELICLSTLQQLLKRLQLDGQEIVTRQLYATELSKGFVEQGEPFERIVVIDVDASLVRASLHDRCLFWNRIGQWCQAAQRQLACLHPTQPECPDNVLLQHPLMLTSSPLLSVCQDEESLRRWMTTDVPPLSPEQQLIGCEQDLALHLFSGFLAYLLPTLKQQLRAAFKKATVEEDSVEFVDDFLLVVPHSPTAVCPTLPECVPGCRQLLDSQGQRITMTFDSPVYPKVVPLLGLSVADGRRLLVFAGCVAPPALLLAKAAGDDEDSARRQLRSLAGALCRCSLHPDLKDSVLSRVCQQSPEGADVSVVTVNDDEEVGERVQETLLSLVQEAIPAPPAREGSVHSVNPFVHISIISESLSSLLSSSLRSQLVRCSVSVVDESEEAERLLMVARLSDLRCPNARTQRVMRHLQQLTLLNRECLLGLLVVVDDPRDVGKDLLAELPQQLTRVPARRIAFVTNLKPDCDSVQVVQPGRAEVREEVLIELLKRLLPTEVSTELTPKLSLTGTAAAASINIVYGYASKIKLDPSSNSLPHWLLLPLSGRFPKESSWQSIASSSLNCSRSTIRWEAGGRAYFRGCYEFDSQLQPEGGRCRVGFEIPAAVCTAASLLGACNGMQELADSLRRFLRAAECETVCRVVLWDDREFGDKIDDKFVASMLKTVEESAIG